MWIYIPFSREEKVTESHQGDREGRPYKAHKFVESPLR